MISKIIVILKFTLLTITIHLNAYSPTYSLSWGTWEIQQNSAYDVLKDFILVLVWTLRALVEVMSNQGLKCDQLSRSMWETEWT